MRIHLRRLALVLALLTMTVSASLAFAQDEAEATQTAEQGYQSGATIVLLLGIAAFALVSIIWYARERSAPNGDEAS